MPWPRLSAKERGNCGAVGAGGRVNDHNDSDTDKASSSLPTTRKNSSIGFFGAATLNATLSPVSRSLTSIEVKQPSQSVSGTIHGLLKPRVSMDSFFLRFQQTMFFFSSFVVTSTSPPPPFLKPSSSPHSPPPPPPPPSSTLSTQKRPPGPGLLRPLLRRPRRQPCHLPPVLPPRRPERAQGADPGEEGLRRRALRGLGLFHGVPRARAVAQGGLGAEGGLLGDRVRGHRDGEDAFPQGGLPRV